MLHAAITATLVICTTRSSSTRAVMAFSTKSFLSTSERVRQIQLSSISIANNEQLQTFRKIYPADPEETFRKMQEKHRPIASSFVPSTFNPHPFLTNNHFQTISGVFLRKNPDCAYVASSDSNVTSMTKVLAAISDMPPKSNEMECEFWDARQRMSTSCQLDFYTVDIKYAASACTENEEELRTTHKFQSAQSQGMVILIHGLESNSNSSLSTDMASAYSQSGFDVACLNFRGCCGSPNESLGGYHLGFTDDLRHFLKYVSELWEGVNDIDSNNNSRSDDSDDDVNIGEAMTFDKRPIYLSGFSLGANVVVKCLGELGDAAFTLYNVHGAAVTGAPFDCERNIRYVEAPGFNRMVYSRNFLKTLKKRAEYQLEAFCEGDVDTEVFDFKGCMGATTIAEFENAFIARVYGFEDNIDYYRSTSCYYFLKGVAVPLYILNAGDDPFFDPDFFPIEESVDGRSMAPIKMKRTKEGGHLGFMFHQLSDLERKEMGDQNQASWMPMELARFIRHVHNYGE